MTCRPRWQTVWYRHMVKGRRRNGSIVWTYGAICQTYDGPIAGAGRLIILLLMLLHCTLLVNQVYRFYSPNVRGIAISNAVFRLSIYSFFPEIFAIKVWSWAKSLRLGNVFCFLKFYRSGHFKNCSHLSRLPRGMSYGKYLCSVPKLFVEF